MWLAFLLALGLSIFQIVNEVAAMNKRRAAIVRAERASRKNARVLDKIRIALPRELDEMQRAALVEKYMADLTGGSHVPWYAAIHQTGTDAHNPHVHIAVHDRDMKTGRRVLRLSDSTRDRIRAGLPGPKAVDWIRDRWEIVCNRALEQAGHDARIDRRTLEAQGIDREPTIHEGPRAQHINNNVKRPKSKTVTNGAGRVIDYPVIDKGKTRREFNAHIIDLNLERGIRSGNPETAAWAKFEKEQAAEDRQLAKQLTQERRARTKEMRTVSAKYTAQRRRAGAEYRLKSRQTQKQVRAKFGKRRGGLRERQGEQRQVLRQKQRSLLARIARRLSRTVKARHLAVRIHQIETHREERKFLSQTYQQAKEQARDALTARYGAQYGEIDTARSAHLAAVENQHREADDLTDTLRQQREAEREHVRELTEHQIQEWKKQQRQRDGRPGQIQTQSEFTQAAKGDQAKDNMTARALARIRKKKKEEEERQRMGKGQGRERGR